MTNPLGQMRMKSIDKTDIAFVIIVVVILILLLLIIGLLIFLYCEWKRKKRNQSQENDGGSKGMITIQLDSSENNVKRENIKNSDERIVGSGKKGKRKKEKRKKGKKVISSSSLSEGAQYRSPSNQ